MIPMPAVIVTSAIHNVTARDAPVRVLGEAFEPPFDWESPATWAGLVVSLGMPGLQTVPATSMGFEVDATLVVQLNPSPVTRCCPGVAEQGIVVVSSQLPDASAVGIPSNAGVEWSVIVAGADAFQHVPRTTMVAPVA